MAENIQFLNKNDLCFENIGCCCFVVLRSFYLFEDWRSLPYYFVL